jgi:phosphoenolpyruvate carboxykinase (GTP)
VSTPLEQFVEQSAELTQPKEIVWCDGSRAEFERVMAEAIKEGTFIPLNEKTYPNCYLHRSNPNDVARTEHLTLICTSKKEDAGPTNNWMPPAEAKERAAAIFKGAMKGRTMFVLPYIMGPLNSPISKAGVQITDSRYVMISMGIMTRMGKAAMERIGKSADFVPGLHSVADCNPDRRYILHFPEEKLIWSVGSGYGGNALLGKKCFALRIASVQAREEGWLAEHMLILGLESPGGKVTYMAAAFPSACGKTNLAMMVSALEHLGYKVWTVGDDIAWMKIGPDGYLHAINPEAGCFGVAPGTSRKTNPNVMDGLRHDSLFTNVGLTANREPWWEGIDIPPGDGMLDWQGQPYNPAVRPAAHPNSRYTMPIHHIACISPRWEDPDGVPISAFIFGGRRSKTAPLVYEAFDWNHGVFVGATMGSETTAAATGAVGVLRRDPMAMLPFCGYNMADYWAHWLEMGKRIPHPPRIFHVNWFRKGPDGKFLWPGYGENVRVLKWMLDRIEGRGEAVETPIGFVPTENAIPLDGLDISRETMRALLSIDPADWIADLEDSKTFFDKFGDSLPRELREQHAALRQRLERVTVAVK